MEHQPADQRVEATMRFDELVARVAADVEETLRRVIDESLHRSFSEGGVNQRRSYRGKAIWKREPELPRRHVIECEPLDQRDRSVFFRQPPMADRKSVADHPQI